MGLRGLVWEDCKVRGFGKPLCRSVSAWLRGSGDLAGFADANAGAASRRVRCRQAAISGPLQTNYNGRVVTPRHVPSTSRNIPRGMLSAHTGAAPGVHEGPAEVEIGLILVVRRTAQLDVVRVVASSHRERTLVVKLHVRGRVAATSSSVDVAAAPAVALPHGSPQRRGNRARSAHRVFS